MAILVASEFCLFYTSCTLACVNLRISFLSVFLLYTSIPFVEADVLPLLEVDMSVLSNVVEQYEQE